MENDLNIKGYKSNDPKVLEFLDYLGINQDNLLRVSIFIEAGKDIEIEMRYVPFSISGSPEQTVEGEKSTKPNPVLTVKVDKSNISNLVAYEINRLISHSKVWM